MEVRAQPRVSVYTVLLETGSPQFLWHMKGAKAYLVARFLGFSHLCLPP